MIDHLTYTSKFSRDMSFPGEWITASKFETRCGKVFSVDGDHVYLVGSYRAWGPEMGWIKLSRVQDFVPRIHMGKLWVH